MAASPRGIADEWSSARALSHRSILADPSRPEMRDRINAMVKMREAFRPFAPAVTLEQARCWFDVAPGAEFPYMIATVDVRERYRAQLPAITHVNGSARLQTVSAHENPEFHALLRAVGRETGREVVLNTSYNVKGQPIVNTPREAIDTFLGTGIEYLFLDNIQVSKNRARDSISRTARRQKVAFGCFLLTELARFAEVACENSTHPNAFSDLGKVNGGDLNAKCALS